MRFTMIWILANLVYFTYTYEKYTHSSAYSVIGASVSVAKGCGSLLKLNCSFILLPVCRSLMLVMRETFLNNYVMPVDKAIAFHKKIAWSMALISYVHTIAHLYNFAKLSDLNGLELRTTGKRGKPVLHTIPDEIGDDEKWSVVDWLFRTIPGITGIIICVVMLFMFSTAARKIRNPYFEAFWYTHHLFIIFFFMLLLHGVQALIADPEYWMWFIGPGTLYAYERYARYKRGEQITIVVDAIAHPSKVMEIRFQKEGFNYKVGQYLFLNVPHISEKEWHPFTISSCPADAYVSCHIRSAGDWTSEAHKLFLKSEFRDEIMKTSAIGGRAALRVDGPFGSAADKCMTDYSVAVLIAAGIGVTPFSAILKEIRVRYLSGVDFPLRKVYFIWTSRDKEAFEWFAALLSEFESGDLNGFLSINVYLTGGMKTDDIRNIVYADGDKDTLTGLQAGTQFGRPNFNAIMSELSELHVGERIGVFLCGPRALAGGIRKECRRFTIPGSTTFVFNKENF